MRCQGCGKKLTNNEEFCTVCGFYNNRELSLENDALGHISDFKDPSDDEIEILDEYEEVDDDYKIEEPVIEEVNFEDSNDDDNDSYDNTTYDDLDFSEDRKDSEMDYYIETYIGEDYKWVAKRPINIYALLLSWIYFLYRKLYIIGILGLAVTGVVVKFYWASLPYYVFIVMLLCGLLFNPIYMFIVKRRVKRYKRMYEAGRELEEVCYKKGGVNTPRALFIFCIFLAILLFTYIHIDFGKEKPNYWKENNENKANCLLIAKKAYSMIDKQLILGVIEDSVCNVRITNTKNYDIYLRIIDGEKYQYYYLKNDGKYLSLEGDTTQISKWQRAKDEETIFQEEEEMLETSLGLADKFSKMIEYSNLEEKKINEGTNTSERLYYYLKKEDIYPHK